VIRHLELFRNSIDTDAASLTRLSSCTFRYHSDTYGIVLCRCWHRYLLL